MIDERTRSAIGEQAYRLAVMVEQGQGAGAITERGDDQVGLLKDLIGLVKPLRFQPEQAQPLVGLKSADAKMAAQEIAPGAAQARVGKDPSGPRADIGGAECVISIRQGLSRRIISQSEVLPMQHRDGFAAEGDADRSVQANIGAGHRAMRGPDDRDFRTTSALQQIRHLAWPIMAQKFARLQGLAGKARQQRGVLRQALHTAVGAAGARRSPAQWPSNQSG